MKRMTRSSRIRPLLLLIAAWLTSPPLCTAEATAEPGGPVVAVVNGEEVTGENVARALVELHGSVTPEDRTVIDLDRLIFKVVNDVLIAQEARALGLDQEPDLREETESYRMDLILSKIEQEEIAVKSEPTEEEIDRVFQEQYRRVTFHVVTSYDLAGAESLRAEIEGGADMAEMAFEKSVDPYKLQRGRVEDLPRKSLQSEVGEVVFSLEPGRLSAPIRTNLGWSVVRVESFAPADPERFAELRPTLEALARQRKASARLEEIAGEFQTRHPVNIDRETVAAIQPVPRPDGRLTTELPDPGAVVARIGQSLAITAPEYADTLERRWRGVRNQEAARAAAPIVLDGMIRRRLLLAEALARGYHQLPEVERRVDALETQLLVSSYLEDVLAAGLEVSDEQKRAFYEEHKEKYRRPPKLQLGQITVAEGELATRIATMLRSGADLAWLAAKYSRDRFKETGGQRGWLVARPGPTASSRMLLEAQPGQVLDPFQQGDSWVVVKVFAREEQGIYDFEEISGNIREEVFTQMFARVLDDFITTLRSRSEIEVRHETLATLRISGSRQEASDQNGSSHGR